MPKGGNTENKKGGSNFYSAKATTRQPNSKTVIPVIDKAIIKVRKRRGKIDGQEDTQMRREERRERREGEGKGREGKGRQTVWPERVRRGLV